MHLMNEFIAIISVLRHDEHLVDLKLEPVRKPAKASWVIDLVLPAITETTTLVISILESRWTADLIVAQRRLFPKDLELDNCNVSRHGGRLGSIKLRYDIQALADTPRLSMVIPVLPDSNKEHGCAGTLWIDIDNEDEQNQACGMIDVCIAGKTKKTANSLERKRKEKEDPDNEGDKQHKDDKDSKTRAAKKRMSYAEVDVVDDDEDEEEEEEEDDREEKGDEVSNEEDSPKRSRSRRSEGTASPQSDTSSPDSSASNKRVQPRRSARKP